MEDQDAEARPRTGGMQTDPALTAYGSEPVADRDSTNNREEASPDAFDGEIHLRNLDKLGLQVYERICSLHSYTVVMNMSPENNFFLLLFSATQDER